MATLNLCCLRIQHADRTVSGICFGRRLGRKHVWNVRFSSKLPRGVRSIAERLIYRWVGLRVLQRSDGGRRGLAAIGQRSVRVVSVTHFARRSVTVLFFGHPNVHFGKKNSRNGVQRPLRPRLGDKKRSTGVKHNSASTRSSRGIAGRRAHGSLAAAIGIMIAAAKAWQLSHFAAAIMMPVTAR